MTHRQLLCSDEPRAEGSRRSLQQLGLLLARCAGPMHLPHAFGSARLRRTDSEPWTVTPRKQLSNRMTAKPQARGLPDHDYGVTVWQSPDLQPEMSQVAPAGHLILQLPPAQLPILQVAPWLQLMVQLPPAQAWIEQVVPAVQLLIRHAPPRQSAMSQVFDPCSQDIVQPCWEHVPRLQVAPALHVNAQPEPQLSMRHVAPMHEYLQPAPRQVPVHVADDVQSTLQLSDPHSL